MPARRSWSLGVAALVVVALLATVALGSGMLPRPSGHGPAPSHGHARVTLYDNASGALLATVDARVADTPAERYHGLSNTTPLAPNTGMVFVFPDEKQRAFVMRDMNYPLDMLFVGADGRVNAVHHASLPPPNTSESELKRYTGDAKWVLEVPRGFTAAHNVTVGDRMSVNESTTTSTTHP